MAQLRYTRQFERDIIRMRARGKDLLKIRILIETLAKDMLPDPLHRDHKLAGIWKGRRECHIESDWLLIYKREGDLLIFERTGTHSDLFRK